MECYYGLSVSKEELQIIHDALCHESNTPEMNQLARDLVERFPEILT